MTRDAEAWISVTTPSGLILGRASVDPPDAVQLIAADSQIGIAIQGRSFVVTEGVGLRLRHYVVPFDVRGRLQLAPGDLHVSVQITGRPGRHSAVHKPHNDVLNEAYG